MYNLIKFQLPGISGQLRICTPDAHWNICLDKINVTDWAQWLSQMEKIMML